MGNLGFFSTGDTENDIEILCGAVPFVYWWHFFGELVLKRTPNDQEFKPPFYFCNIMLAKVDSTGRVELNSSDIYGYPNVYLNYLSNENDINRLIAGIKQVRQIFAKSQHIFTQEILPGKELFQVFFVFSLHNKFKN